MDLQTISILASISSLIVSIGAVVLAITFYMGGRNTELRITSALVQIKTQTEALQKLSGRQIDKLLKHAFELSKNGSKDETTKHFMDVLSKLPDALTTKLENQKEPTGDDVQILNTLYIALYFYTAQTNYWSQFYLPKAGEFDHQDQLHQLTKRIVDSSCDDFNHIAKLLAGVDQNMLSQNSLNYMLAETKEEWRHSVKSTSEVFIDRERP